MTTFENHTHAQMHAQKAAVGSARELGGERERQKESWEERGKDKKRVGRREGKTKRELGGEREIQKERWGKERSRGGGLGKREREVEGGM